MTGDLDVYGLVKHDDEPDRAGWPEPIDLRALAATEPAPPPMVIDDWMPAGYATLMAGHGGSGKSAVALQLAACMAAGQPWFGLNVQRSRVLYLSFEDRQSVLHWRLARICRYLGIDMAGLTDLLLMDLVGQTAALWSRDHVPPGYHHLRHAIDAHRPDVIIVDGIADVFDGNENSRSEVKAFVQSMLALSDPERGAVLLLGHVAKPTASGGGGEGYSGSTGWHNAVRARWYLHAESERDEDGRPERTGGLLLALQKSNLGRTDQSIRLRWDGAAQTFVGTVEGGSSHFERRQRDEAERQGILDALREVTDSGDYVPAAMQGPRTAHHVLAAAESFPDTLKSKAATKRFRRHIEHLRRIRVISEGSIRRKNRTHVATLELETAPDVGCTNAPHSVEANTCDSGAVPQCTNAPHSIGGTRGRAHTHGDGCDTCPRCDGEGCRHCEGGGDAPA